MKLFNSVRVLAIILIGVTLLFAILGSMQIKPLHEGFDNAIGCSGEIVPQCHDKVLQFAKYEEDNMDDYILKTEIVVPTCPSCPTYEDKVWYEDEWKPPEGVDNVVREHEVDNTWNEDNYTETKWDSRDDDEIHIKEPTKLFQKEVSENIQTNASSSNLPNTIQSNALPTKLPETIQTKTPPTALPTPVNFGLAGSDTPMNAVPSAVSTPAAANNKDSPPCPACERCPEPAFECKKVPNYRSQSMQNYMPLPVLNDFSKF
jgi:hypothetical protein